MELVSSSFINLTLFEGYSPVLIITVTDRLHLMWLCLPNNRHSSELFKSWKLSEWIILTDYEFLVSCPQPQAATQGDF